MRLLHLPLALALACVSATTTGCAVTQKEASDREWQRSECNRIVDREARERCLKRVE